MVMIIQVCWYPSKAKSLPWIFEAYEVFFRNVGELMSGNQSSSETVDKVHEAWSSIKSQQH